MTFNVTSSITVLEAAT